MLPAMPRRFSRKVWFSRGPNPGPRRNFHNFDGQHRTLTLHAAPAQLKGLPASVAILHRYLAGDAVDGLEATANGL
jgi:hypothetical protein